MKTQIPKPNIAHISNKPIAKKISETKWGFSFKYYNQIKYFGLNMTDPKWFASMLQQLSELNKMDIFKKIEDYHFRDSIRYHEINWSSTNVPIKRSDLNWIDSEYLHNDEDFPMMQFQISQALGRVVGFWDEENTIFFIVLLDPLHNIQPSKRYSYKVDDCYPLSSQYSSLLMQIESLKSKSLCNNNCNLKSALRKIPDKVEETNAVVIFLDRDFYELLCKHDDKSLSEIFELGLLSIE